MERAYAAFNTKAEAQLAHDAAAAEARTEAALAEQQRKRVSDLAAVGRSRRQQLAEREAGRARCRVQEQEEKAASERLLAQAKALEVRDCAVSSLPHASACMTPAFLPAAG
jgi:urease accessory protein UreH